MKDKFPYKFRPTPEITAYDLAMIFVADGAMNASEKVYSKLPEEVKRFYKKDEE